uniref:Sox C-terminal domain-containing protein n=1 Tax=Streptomyces sp. NBC_00093 TaxID=2975649 RepID=A0AAU2AJD6_9ACTN
MATPPHHHPHTRLQDPLRPAAWADFLSDVGRRSTRR